MKILAIEDNPRLADRIKRQLQKWYIVELAHSGHEALTKITTGTFSLVLLYLGLPDMPGLEVCQRIRDLYGDIPILVLTGIDATPSRVELLNAGADDYMAKPFDPAELQARINALLRRRVHQRLQEHLVAGDLQLDSGKRTVTRSGVHIKLRRKEFNILEFLLLNKGRVVSRNMILNHAWESTSAGWTGSIDVHIKQLRDKVDKPFAYPLIKTSYGVGYMLEEPEPSSHPEQTEANKEA